MQFPTKLPIEPICADQTNRDRAHMSRSDFQQHVRGAGRGRSTRAPRRGSRRRSLFSWEPPLHPPPRKGCATRARRRQMPISRVDRLDPISRRLPQSQKGEKPFVRISMEGGGEKGEARPVRPDDVPDMVPRHGVSRRQMRAHEHARADHNGSTAIGSSRGPNNGSCEGRSKTEGRRKDGANPPGNGSFLSAE